jgi:purine-binding chemotaxis protein CheW
MTDNKFNQDQAQESSKTSIIKQIVVFDLDGEEYAVPIEDVKEVIKLSEITPLPSSPIFILGIINLRGNIIPVLDLEKRFSLQRKKEQSHSHILITETESSFGILVDKVTEVLNIKAEQIQPPPQVISNKINHNYLQGVIVINDNDEDKEEKIEKNNQQPTPETQTNQRVLLILKMGEIVSEKELENLTTTQATIPDQKQADQTPKTPPVEPEKNKEMPKSENLEKSEAPVPSSTPVEKKPKNRLSPSDILSRIKNKVLNPS